MCWSCCLFWILLRDLYAVMYCMIYMFFFPLVRFFCESELSVLAGRSNRLICNLNQKVEWDRRSSKKIYKYGNWYSISRAMEFSLWLQTSYLFIIFIYSSVKEG